MIITISGEPGAGKTTVSKGLAGRLDMKYFYVGKLLRKIGLKQGDTLINISKKAEKNFTIDKYLDSYLKKLSDKDNYVIDARLGFYFIPKSFKILLKVNSKVGVERILNDKRIGEEPYNFDKLMKEVERRKKSERIRYTKYYNINIDDENNFDLIINTSYLCAENVVSIIIQFLFDKGVLNV